MSGAIKMALGALAMAGGYLLVWRGSAQYRHERRRPPEGAHSHSCECGHSWIHTTDPSATDGAKLRDHICSQCDRVVITARHVRVSPQ